VCPASSGRHGTLSAIAKIRIGGAIYIAIDAAGRHGLHVIRITRIKRLQGSESNAQGQHENKEIIGVGQSVILESAHVLVVSSTLSS
jgi:hypothetical protein